MEDIFSILGDIASKTIGFDINPTSIKNNIQSDESDELIKMVVSENEVPQWRKGCVEYNLSEAEKNVICKLTKLNNLEGYEITQNSSGQIIVTSPCSTWLSLCGREWLIDLDNLNVELMRMS